MGRTGRRAARQVGSVQRAVDVLDAPAAAGTELGTNEIARRTGVNVSSISRLLSTLTANGLVQHVPSTGRYRLGVRILQLADAARGSFGVRGRARPYLEELSAITGETSTLSLPGSHDLVTIDFVPSPQSVRSVAQIGRNSVAHATSAGKVLLAWGGRLPERELTAYTERTITDRDALDAEIAKVRERGWAQAVGEPRGRPERGGRAGPGRLGHPGRRNSGCRARRAGSRHARGDRTARRARAGPGVRMVTVRGPARRQFRR